MAKDAQQPTCDSCGDPVGAVFAVDCCDRQVCSVCRKVEPVSGSKPFVCCPEHHQKKARRKEPGAGVKR